MRYFLLLCLAAIAANACTQGPGASYTGAFPLDVNIDCSLSDAVSAANNPGQTYGGCPVVPVSPPPVINVPQGTYDLQVRLNIFRPMTIQGDCSSAAFECTADPDPAAACASFPVLDMGARDRAFLQQATNVHLRCLVLRDVCPNGGLCTAIVNNSVPAGGGWYALLTASSTYEHIVVDGGRAQTGCGFGLCSGEALTEQTQPVIDRVAVVGCTATGGGGGGAVDHVSRSTIRNTYFRGNQARTGQADGGSLKIYGGWKRLENVHMIGGVSEFGQGGNLSVAAITNQAVTNTDPIVVDVVGGSIAGGTANGNGGNVAASAGRLQDVYVNLTDVEISGGTADSPTGWPPGNGGQVSAVDFAGSAGQPPHLATVRLYGSTSFTGGSDLSSPAHPDTFGRVEDLRNLPVCGDGVPEGGEGCDDGNTASGDGCSASCAPEVCEEQCTTVCQ